eukprot:gene936-biopygen777
MDRYPNTARSTRQRRNSVKIDKAPETPRALRRVPRKSTKAEVDETDLVQVLADPVPQGLNSVGLRQQGKAASPNSWYVYQDKPYFLQPTAWRAKTSDTRKLHIRWINEIKSMPAEYLDRDLPQAIMEYVRHIAVMRQWKWSTYAKNLSAIESALESLPLYTNQKKGIFLKECPEWRDNLLGAQLKERESVAQPPEPLTIDMYDKARKALEHREPVAELYLTMLWMFAARPADVSRLRVRDVTIGQPHDSGTVPVQLTIREGKAAKFRGPYPVASILTRQQASMLQQLMKERSASQRIFSEPAVIRSKTLAEVKKVCAEATLQSLRKGAVRHLAQQGVPEDQLMLMTGHTQINTLRKYLGYGRQLTAEGAEAQGNAVLLHPEQSNSETERRAPRTSRSGTRRSTV